MSTIDNRSRASRGVRAEAPRRRPSPSRKPQKHATRILPRGLGRRQRARIDDADRVTRIVASHHTYSYGKRLRTASRVALLRQRKEDRVRIAPKKSTGLGFPRVLAGRLSRSRLQYRNMNRHIISLVRPNGPAFLSKSLSHVPLVFF